MTNAIHNYQIKFADENYDYLFLDNIGHVATLPHAYQNYINKIESFINKYETNKIKRKYNSKK